MTVNNNDPFYFLSKDIVVGEILSKLDVKSLKNSQLVCKKWNKLSNDEKLWVGFLSKAFPSFSLPKGTSAKSILARAISSEDSLVKCFVKFAGKVAKGESGVITCYETPEIKRRGILSLTIGKEGAPQKSQSLICTPELYAKMKGTFSYTDKNPLNCNVQWQLTVCDMKILPWTQIQQRIAAALQSNDKSACIIV